MIYKEIVKVFNKDNTKQTKTKLLANFIITYTKLRRKPNPDSDPDNIQYIYKEENNYFNAGKTETMISHNQIKEYVEKRLSKFYDELESPNFGSSGVFYRIDNIVIQIARRTKTRAGTYIKLDDKLIAKHACVNIQNKKDNYCLIWCLLAHKYNVKKDAHETYHYKKHFDEIKQPDDIIYPIDIQHDIPKFERLNNIKINVFEYDKNDKKFENLRTVYNTNEVNENVINLLLVDEKNNDGTKNEHLVWIKDFNKLKRMNSSHFGALNV